MLRRHSTKSRADLHRRKSTTSVRSVHLEHIDATVAQRDAQTAAMEAFSRAHGRQSAGGALFPPRPVPATKENTSPSGLSRMGSTASLESKHRGQGLGRRQSVRFIGPGPGLQTRSSRITMRTAAPEQPEIPPRHPLHRSQSTQSIGYTPRSVLRSSEGTAPPDRTWSGGNTMVTPRTAKTELSQACLQALSPDYPQYTPEDDVASMPSSYRRIRKTRSMLTTRTSMRGSADGNTFGSHNSRPHNTDTMAHSQKTIFPRYSFTKKRDSNTAPSTPNLRPPKSMSFLKCRRDRPDKRSSMGSPDGDCDAPPGLDAQEPSSRSRILPRPPKIFGPKSAETETGMPKTLRVSSANIETPESGTSVGLDRSRSGSLRSRARKVSTSLRSKFKHLFVNKSEEESKLPAQQIEAQRTHVSEVSEENPWAPTTPEHRHCRERSSLSRVSARVPSLHTVPSHELLHSRRGSIDSCKSASGQTADERSRVTSWASTETNTVIAHRPQEHVEEWEGQRLSMINENRTQDSMLISGYSGIGLQTITSQEELAPPGALQRLPPGATVDSQRVYSALIKKMNETQQLAGLVEQQRKSSDGSDPFRTLSPSSSNGSVHSSGAATPTQQRLSIPGKDTATYPDCARDASERAGSPSSEITQSTAGDQPSLSPPTHLTPRGGGAVTAKPITDRGSAFFGSPTSHLFRTTSPYRRSLQEAMRAERGQASGQGSAETTGTTTSSASRLKTAANAAYSESNYSSDTLIHKTEMDPGYSVAQNVSLADSQGEASILEESPTYRPTGERHVSTSSSIGWKTWLSADIARLEPSPTRVSGQPPEVEYRIPTMPRSLGHGHVREAAQAGSFEEDEGNANLSVRMPTSSLTPLRAIDSNMVKLSPHQRSTMCASTPPADDLRQGPAQTPSDGNAWVPSHEGGGLESLYKDTALVPASSPEKTRPSIDDRSAAQPQTPARGRAVRQSKSLAGLKSMSRIREPQTGSPQPPVSSTVRLMRKPACKLSLNPGSATSSPGFTGAFERQFGSIGHSLDGQLAEKENQVPHRDNALRPSPGTKGQPRGSKAMVDLFLHSRRRQGASSGDASALV